VRGNGPRLWLFRLLFPLLLTGVTVVGGELMVRAVAPQALNGRWSEMADSGLLVNRANWTARHRFGESEVQYRINEHHLRGGPIGPGKRVLVLGDSFTFGWLLPEEETYVHLLGRAADREFGRGRFQFLNGGRGGWGTGDYLAFLEEFGEPIAPTAVVVFLNFADIHRSVSGGLYRFRDAEAGELERRPGKVSALRKFKDHWVAYDWLLGHSHFFHVIRNGAEGIKRRRVRGRECSVPGPQAAGEATDRGAAGAALGRALFRRLHHWCEQRGVPLLVVTTGFQAHFLRPPACGSFHDQIFLRGGAEFFAREGVPFHDLSAELAREVQSQWNVHLIPVDGHPNARGARLVTHLAWPWLQPHLRKCAGAARP
jgi:lysophospholipase L1-like esterase